MIDDTELLRRYVQEQSDDAFAIVVRRHIDFVYQTALRQVGRDAHHASDVTQFVFSQVARQAPALASHRVLKGWLYTTTRNAAANLVRAERRRRNRELKAHMMQETTNEPPEPADWEELRPVIDHALSALSARDREAVFLRYFEGCEFPEIGARFSLTADAARLRVE